MPGSEPVWIGSLQRDDGQVSHYKAFMTSQFRFLGFWPDAGPTWTLKQFDWDRDPKRMGLMEALFNAQNPDLRGFKAAGGKMISFHGWNDHIVQPEATADYYETVERVMGGRAQTQSFYRLFMAPGVNHCQSGSGAYAVDWFGALENWVEHGQAPDRIVAVRPVDPKGGLYPRFFTPDAGVMDNAVFSRPLFPYPSKAVYSGQGDPGQQSSLQGGEMSRALRTAVWCGAFSTLHLAAAAAEPANPLKPGDSFATARLPRDGGGAGRRGDAGLDRGGPRAVQHPKLFADRERLQMHVTIARPFAVGKFEVTRGMYARYVAAAGVQTEPGCYGFDVKTGTWPFRAELSWRDPGFPQGDDEPVVCMNYPDAKGFVAWLAKLTGQPYRLLSETEWEYAARGGATTTYPWGDSIAAICEKANIYDKPTAAALGDKEGMADEVCDRPFKKTFVEPVGSYPPNAFGLYDMIGNAWEMVEGCATDTYEGVPTDGRPLMRDDCTRRMPRGGGWNSRAWTARLAIRGQGDAAYRGVALGIRVGARPALRAAGRVAWRPAAGDQRPVDGGWYGPKLSAGSGRPDRDNVPAPGTDTRAARKPRCRLRGRPGRSPVRRIGHAPSASAPAARRAAGRVRPRPRGSPGSRRSRHRRCPGCGFWPGIMKRRKNDCVAARPPISRSTVS